MEISGMKSYVYVAIVAAVIGGVSVYLITPAKVVTETKTEVKTEYKTDEKVIQAAIEDWKKDHKDWWKEVQYIKVPCPKCPRADSCAPCQECSENVQIVYVEKQGGSQEQSEGSKNSSSETDRQSQGKSSETVSEKFLPAQWMVTGLVGLDASNISFKNVQGPVAYGAVAQRRIYKGLWGGVWGTHGADTQVGLSLSFEW